MFRDRFLLAALAVQAALLSFRLDLATVWGDEHFTLGVARQPVEQLLRTVSGDIHPPLYFLLVHEWLRLPLGLSAAVQARLLSVVFTLLATVIVYRCWGREGETRRWFLVLWIFSPCLLLYGRMARSYTLQVAIAALALRLGYDLVYEAGSTRRAIWFGLASALLLYIHYAPGVAVLAAVGLLLLWKRRWRVAVVSGAVMLAAYLPWLAVLSQAFGRVARQDAYAASASWPIDQAMRLVFWSVSFTFGESLPLPLLLAGMVLAPFVAWAFVGAVRSAPAWLPLAGLCAVIGYAGVARWVSYPFIPARMLFVLPFFLLLLARAARLRIWLAAFSLAAGVAYFHKAGFLNKAYVAPHAEMVAALLQAPELPQLVLIDPFNSDAWALKDAFGDRVPVQVLGGAAPASVSAASIALIHVSRDTTPGGRNRALVETLSKGREFYTQKFLPHDAADRFMMRMLGDQNPPTHYFEVTTYRKR